MDSRSGSVKTSIIGFDPNTIINVKNRIVKVGNIGLKDVDPITVLKSILKLNVSPKPFKYIGGAVGYISYDAIRYWENLPSNSVDDLNFPDIEMGIYSDGLIFDHNNREAFYFYRGSNRYEELAMMVNKPVDFSELSFSELEVNVDREHHREMVEKAKEYIYSGDILQVVLSKRYTAKFKGGFEKFYFNLKKINPSPYMYFFKMEDRFIIGSSPETLVKVENGVIETCPIAGTRPITGDPDRDYILEMDLLTDSKEIVEHIMLVDLARNDIGKVSKYGSVKVTEFMKVYRYSHVQHIVSKVVGELDKSYDCLDVLKAVFPAGTVSGAPKIRAMEIIDELEGVRRGPYAGAVGYFSVNGNMDFAITIRTLFAKGDKFHIQVGSGIVADSTPEGEWLETEFKVRALIDALTKSRGVG